MLPLLCNDSILVLQFAVAHGTGEGENVADVGHAGQVHDTALEAQTEAGVTGGASGEGWINSKCN